MWRGRWWITGLVLLALLAGGCEVGHRSSGRPEDTAALADPPDAYDPTPQPYLYTPPADAAHSEERDLLPQTVAALHRALDGLGIPWFVSAGISLDPASGDTHRPDGRSAGGRYYSAAMDVSIAGATGKTPRSACGVRKRRAGACLGATNDARFRWLVQALRDAGFAAWYRHTYVRATGEWEMEIHAIDPAAPFIKESLRRQMDDYLRGRDGLVGHRSRDAAGPIVPDRTAFCRREGLSAHIAGYTPFGRDRVAYRPRTCRIA